MGSPTVIADIATTGANPQIVSRLWDVGPDGNQTLVARGVYRPDASGRQVFQLHPNGWRFAQGHVPKLQLLGDRKSTRLKSSHANTSYALFCLKKNKQGIPSIPGGF